MHDMPGTGRRVACAVCLLASAAVWATEPAKLPQTTPWNIEALSNAPDFKWLNRDGKVHSLTYRGEVYQGKPTRVFAYYASPATLGEAPALKNVPGIVLVHGGGGAAFSKWAELWASRGYAAIAMDLAGRGEGRKRLDDGGPDQTPQAKFSAIDGPVKDQWPYHAVANVVLAHSLLRELDDVDARRTALTGISWGGYLTCIVAGLDQRFQVAMPVYGCGFLRDNSAWVESQFKKMKPEQVEKWHVLWDPSQYIGAASMPVIFVNGTNDFAYPMDSYSRTCALVRGDKNFSIQLNMRHGHIFDFPEFFVFVDQYLKSGTPMPLVARPVVDGERVTARVTSSTRLSKARLLYTTGAHKDNKTRAWVAQPLEVTLDKVHGAAAPADANVWYIEVTDERQAVASSEVMLRN